MAGGAPGKDSPEWLHTTTKNMRNFIRKWGTMVKHDSLMKPIVVSKYDIGFIIKNCTENLLEILEPWCSTIYIDHSFDAKHYIDKEQPNTLFDLGKKIQSIHGKKVNDILVEFDATKLNQEQLNYIVQLPEIITNEEEDLSTGESGDEFELGIFKVTINKLKTYEEELIKCER